MKAKTEETDDPFWKNLRFCIISEDGVLGSFTRTEEGKFRFKPLLLSNHRSSTRLAHRLTRLTEQGFTVSLYDTSTGAVMQRDIPDGRTYLRKDGRKNVSLGDYVKRPVINRDTGETFESVSEAARATGIPRNAVSEVLAGKRKPTPGRHFEYVIVKPDRKGEPC